MLVPRRCHAPNAMGQGGRFAATGYLSPADLLLDGSTVYGEGQMYDSDLIDAAGYNSIMFVVFLQGSTTAIVDYEWHYIDPKALVNPAPSFQFSGWYTDIHVDEGPFVYTWGANSPNPGIGSWKDLAPFVGAFHMSFVFLNDLTNPTAWAFFCTRPTPAPGG